MQALTNASPKTNVNKKKNSTNVNENIIITVKSGTWLSKQGNAMTMEAMFYGLISTTPTQEMIFLKSFMKVTILVFIH